MLVLWQTIISHRNFEIGAKWQYLSGTSEAPVNSITLIQDPITRGIESTCSLPLKRTSLLNSNRIISWTCGISRKWKLWGTQIGGFLDIINIYNRKNKIKIVIDEPQEGHRD